MFQMIRNRCIVIFAKKSWAIAGLFLPLFIPLLSHRIPTVHESPQPWPFWFQVRPVGAVDNTTAHQVGKFQTSVAFQLQKFNPLFTLVFTQITAMEFTVFGNILSNSRVTLSKLNTKFFQCDSTLTLVTENIPEYCKFHRSDLGKNQCKQGIKFLQL